MSQKSSPTYVFTTEDYDSSSPKFLTGGDFTRDMRFATKVIPLRLSTTKHSVITISIHPSDNVIMDVYLSHTQMVNRYHRLIRN